MNKTTPAALITAQTSLSSRRFAAALLATTALCLCAGVAQAQEAASKPLVLPTLRVEGETSNVLKKEVGTSTMPNSVQDTPQQITVITQDTLRQQNVATLDQALRSNVPGVSVTIGEGGGGMNGDQFRIRGIDAKDDIYIDGLRDFGVYTRDAFNYEQIEVVKGPSGLAFGRGTTGGGINTTSKTPKLDNFYSATASLGNGNYKRLTGDANYQLNDTIAIRLNAMVHDQEFVKRDDLVDSRRWGFAPSIGFGLGTDTTFTLAYLHQEDNRMPDYGVTVVTPTGSTIGRPVTEFGVDRSNFYGWDADYDRTQADVLTARFKQKTNDWLTITNDTRLGFYSREFTASPMSCNATCVTNLFDNNPATVPLFTTGGPGPYAQDSWGVQNLTVALMEFELGGMKNQMQLGVDMSYQHNKRTFYQYSPARNTITRNLLDPSHASPYGIIPVTAPASNARAITEGNNIGAFISDQIWFTPEISLLAGVRWEKQQTDYTTYQAGGTFTKLEANSDYLNPRASLIYEPTDDQTYYISWARSATPSGTSITSAPSALSATNQDLAPEKNESFEIGAKVSLFDGKLGLSSAIFQVDKNNAKDIDPISGNILSSGEKQRIRGFEIGAGGQINSIWSVTGNYTYLDTEIREAFTGTPPALNLAAIGKKVQYVPKHAASFWTTLVPVENLTVGAGVTWRSKVYLNNTNLSEAPSNFQLDGLVTYQLEQYRFSLNAYNLTNKLNYDQVWTNRVVPSAGRTFIASVGVDF